MSQFTIKNTAEEVATTLQEEIKGKNILITGVSPDSLGEEAVRVLAPYANLVIVASRNKEKTQGTVDRRVAQVPSANIKVVVLDISSISSIKAAATEVTEPIHVLINNAAVPMAVELAHTTDGFESQLEATIGNFSPRVINVSSIAHQSGTIRFDDPDFRFRPQDCNKLVGYAQSKVANVLFSYEFAKRFGKENLLSFSLHPGGVVDTPMGGSVSKDELKSFGLVNPDGTYVNPDMWKTIPSGTATHIVAAFDPSITGHNGSYLVDAALAPSEISPHAQDPVVAQKLWVLSEELLGIKF